MSSFPSAAAAILAANSLKPVLLRASGAVTANGDSGPLKNDARELVVGIDVTAVGVGGSITFVLEHQHLDGVWHVLHTFPAISAPGKAQAQIGPGMPVNALPTGTLRLRWDVVVGATFSASIAGR